MKLRTKLKIIWCVLRSSPWLVCYGPVSANGTYKTAWMVPDK